MTDLEILSQREHDAKIKQLRSEFFLLWPDIWKNYERSAFETSEQFARDIAWQVFRKAREL